MIPTPGFSADPFYIASSDPPAPHGRPPDISTRVFPVGAPEAVTIDAKRTESTGANLDAQPGIDNYSLLRRSPSNPVISLY